MHANAPETTALLSALRSATAETCVGILANRTYGVTGTNVANSKAVVMLDAQFVKADTGEILV